MQIATIPKPNTSTNKENEGSAVLPDTPKQKNIISGNNMLDFSLLEKTLNNGR